MPNWAVPARRWPGSWVSRAHAPNRCRSRMARSMRRLRSALKVSLAHAQVEIGAFLLKAIEKPPLCRDALAGDRWRQIEK